MWDSKSLTECHVSVCYGIVVFIGTPADNIQFKSQCNENMQSLTNVFILSDRFKTLYLRKKETHGRVSYNFHKDFYGMVLRDENPHYQLISFSNTFKFNFNYDESPTISIYLFINPSHQSEEGAEKEIIRRIKDYISARGLPFSFQPSDIELTFNYPEEGDEKMVMRME
jgi:hypothetical protein